MARPEIAVNQAGAARAPELAETMASRSSSSRCSRAVALIATVIVGVYLTILIANMGGHVDEIRRGQIREIVGFGRPRKSRAPDSRSKSAPWSSRTSSPSKRSGWDSINPSSSAAYPLGQALTLDLGRAQYMTSDSGSRQVRLIILGATRTDPPAVCHGRAPPLFRSVFVAALSLPPIRQPLRSPHRRARLPRRRLHRGFTASSSS